MSEEEGPPKEEEAGAPAWVMTFADLMSLLMCFFVLLLSFSQMDLQKFKQVSGSMENAFGVQREIKAKESPKGTSIVAREFAPGKPEPTVIKQIRQVTTNDTKPNVETHTSDGGELTIDEQKRKQELEASENARLLADVLADEIQEGIISVEIRDSNVIIRVIDRGAFPAGNIEVAPEFTHVLTRIGQALHVMDGRIEIAGHTDDNAAEGSNYRSNWDLSSARAASVALELFEEGDKDFERVVVMGYADTKPIADNYTKGGREKNRRIEITLRKGDTRISNAKTLYSGP